MTNIKIKSTTGLILNGNKLSGNTYPVKEYIKAYLGGKWDSNSKSWIVDAAKVDFLIESGGNIYLDDSPAPAPKKSTYVSGWCNKCHSYCYGDCTS